MVPTVVAPVVTAAPAAVTATPVVVPAVTAAAVMAVPTAEATNNRPMLPSTILFVVALARVPFPLTFLSEINVRSVFFPTVNLVGVMATVDLFGVVGATDVVVATVDVVVVEASGSVLSITNTNASYILLRVEWHHIKIYNDRVILY